MADVRTSAYDRYAPALFEYAALEPDDPRRAGLRDTLVRAFRPVARHVAARYARRGEPVEDLEQVAVIGLLNALNRFDPATGTDFLSYVIPTMMGEVRRYFRDVSWVVRTPRGIKDRYVAVGAGSAAFTQHHGRSPTVPELAEFLGMEPDDIHEAYAAACSLRPLSLDQSLGEADQDSLLEVIGEIDGRFDHVDLRNEVGALIAQLPSRERRMLVLRFVHEWTQREIGAELHISQMHVSRLLTRTLALLRERLEATERRRSA